MAGVVVVAVVGDVVADVAVVVAVAVAVVAEDPVTPAGAAAPSPAVGGGLAGWEGRCGC